jgi:hypothetical protein
MNEGLITLAVVVLVMSMIGTTGIRISRPLIVGIIAVLVLMKVFGNG